METLLETVFLWIGENPLLAVFTFGIGITIILGIIKRIFK